MTTLMGDGRLAGRNLRGVGGACVPVSFPVNLKMHIKMNQRHFFVPKMEIINVLVLVVSGHMPFLQTVVQKILKLGLS